MVGSATNYHKNIGKWVLLALVVLHIAAIVFYLWRKHHLVHAMLHGDKELVAAVPALRDDTASRLAALAVLGVYAAAVYRLSSLAAPVF